jgi:hypothetical protein
MIVCDEPAIAATLAKQQGQGKQQLHALRNHSKCRKFAQGNLTSKLRTGFCWQPDASQATVCGYLGCTHRLPLTNRREAHVSACQT